MDTTKYIFAISKKFLKLRNDRVQDFENKLITIFRTRGENL